MSGHARELLRWMLRDDCPHLVSIPEDGTEGQSAGLCTLEALEAIERLERAGWQFVPPTPSQLARAGELGHD